MIAGLIIWSSFTAAMTTNLSVKVPRKPFDSLETFLESNYEYVPVVTSIMYILCTRFSYRKQINNKMC